MSNYDSKNELVGARQLKVQELCIPLAITGNATPASVILRNDEPAIMFLQSEGVDQITAALDAGETATYTSTADDSDGRFRILIKVQEAVGKVCGATAYNRVTAENIPVFLGSATGITTGSAGGKSIMLVADSAVDLSAANLGACIVVKYVCAE